MADDNHPVTVDKLTTRAMAAMRRIKQHQHAMAKVAEQAQANQKAQAQTGGDQQ